MTPLIIVIISAIIILMIILLIQQNSNYLFIILIEKEKVKVVKGEPPTSFIEECMEIAKIHKTIRGRIMGIKQDGQIRLKFSHSIQYYAQIFRNVWP